jgi:hypothetical protein
MSAESPTDTELLQVILWRLRRIEKHLRIPEWQIGDPDPPPRSGDHKIVPVETSESKPRGTSPSPL